MFTKLQEIERRYHELQELVSDANTLKDQKKYKEAMQELSSAAEVMEVYNRYRKIEEQITNSRELLKTESDAGLLELAKEDLKNLEKRREEAVANLKLLIIPKDPLDLKNIIMEIRAGTGARKQPSSWRTYSACIAVMLKRKNGRSRS